MVGRRLPPITETALVNHRESDSWVTTRPTPSHRANHGPHRLTSMLLPAVVSPALAWIADHW